jgi:hypothetical protein
MFIILTYLYSKSFYMMNFITLNYFAKKLIISVQHFINILNTRINKLINKNINYNLIKYTITL